MTGDGEDILHFWFDEIGPDRWWVRSKDTDAACIDRFRELWEAWRSRTPEASSAPRAKRWPA